MNIPVFPAFFLCYSKLLKKKKHNKNDLCNASTGSDVLLEKLLHWKIRAERLVEKLFEDGQKKNTSNGKTNTFFAQPGIG